VIMTFFDWSKSILIFLGERLSARALERVRAVASYLELGHWMHAKHYAAYKRFTNREELFDFVGTQVGNLEVIYLEFGVFKGEATRHWSKVLLNPNSVLHGFDSFEGLPEDWLINMQKGHFSTNGMIPKIDDPRIKFFKGWFNETLPNYRCPKRDVMILNMDADIYSSTIYVLKALKDYIVPGTYVYFDEFNQSQHELKAFNEFMDETGMKFSLLGATPTMQHVLFRRDN
jgi:hypothetical protein